MKAAKPWPKWTFGLQKNMDRYVAGLRLNLLKTEGAPPMVTWMRK